MPLPSVNQDDQALSTLTGDASSSPLQGVNTPPAQPQQQVPNTSGSLSEPQQRSASPLEIILSILGGPGVAQGLAQQYRQQQLAPIFAEMDMKFNSAIRSGDIDKAQSLLAQFNKVSQFSPYAFQKYSQYADAFNKITNKVQEVSALVDANYEQAQEGSGAKRFMDAVRKNPYAFTPDQVQKGIQTYAHTGQIIGGIRYTQEGQTANITSGPQVFPQATTPETMSKSIRDALITNVGPGAEQRYGYLQNKSIAQTLTPQEQLELKAYNTAIGPQAAKNVEMGYLPPAEAVKMNLRPGLPREITSPQGTAPAPAQQGKGQSSVPSTPQQGSTQNLEQQRLIFQVNEMVRSGEISQDQGIKILSNRGIQVHQPQGPYQEARQSQIAADVQETTQKAVGQYQAQYGYKPEEQLRGFKVDKNGHLLQSPSGMSNEQLNSQGWHVETFPDAQSKGLTDFPKFQGMYEHVKEEVSTNPVFKEPEKYKAWWDIAKTYIQQGVPIPFTSVSMGGMALGSDDRKYLASALATMGQMVELIANPANKDNVAIAALKNYITSPNAKPSGIISALDAVHDIALAGVKGIVGTTKGAVEEGVTPRQIKQERERRAAPQHVPTEDTSSTPPNRKPPFDRSKVKRVQ